MTVQAQAVRMLGGVAGTLTGAFAVSSVGSVEIEAQYLLHRDDIMDAYAEGLTRRQAMYGDGSVFTAEDLTPAQIGDAHDAFRHSYASGYLKMHFGEGAASSFDSWEVIAPRIYSATNAAKALYHGADIPQAYDILTNVKPSGAQMDYWNNAIMRHEDVTQENLVPTILEKMRTNELALDQIDPRLAVYEGPGLPHVNLAKNMFTVAEPSAADYFGFEGRDDVPVIEDNTEGAIQWAYEELLNRDESLALSGDNRADVSALHGAAEGDAAMQRYLEHIDYDLASAEAAAGVQDVKPVVGVTPDVPSTLSDDDPLLNPAGYDAPPLRGSGMQ